MMAKDDKSNETTPTSAPSQSPMGTGFASEAVTHHSTTEVSPASAPIATGSRLDAPDTTSQDPDRVEGDVELYMAYPQDQFKYGEGDDDVLLGNKTKKFSRDEADRILQLARMSNLQVLERKPEDGS